jgi:hypothetical protein
MLFTHDRLGGFTVMRIAGVPDSLRQLDMSHRRWYHDDTSRVTHHGTHHARDMVTTPHAKSAAAPG